nr:MAG TPA: hypothetical protein [Caudoviricetes sp.]
MLGVWVLGCAIPLLWLHFCRTGAKRWHSMGSIGTPKRFPSS